MTTHSMKLTVEPFAAIARGDKTVESRLYDKKRQAVQLGDTIIFCRSDDQTQQINAVVIGLLQYETFEVMYRHNEALKFGKPSVGELLDQITMFYSLADQKQNGVMGIEFRIV